MQSLHQEISLLRGSLHQHVNSDKLEDKTIDIKKQAHSIKQGIDKVT